MTRLGASPRTAATTIRRWEPARDALWDFVGPHLADGARVVVLGAGNGDDLPLRRIARRAGSLTLVDLDAKAARSARRRLPWPLRRRVRIFEHDVTGGVADRPSPPSPVAYSSGSPDRSS